MCVLVSLCCKLTKQIKLAEFWVKFHFLSFEWFWSILTCWKRMWYLFFDLKSIYVSFKQFDSRSETQKGTKKPMKRKKEPEKHFYRTENLSIIWYFRKLRKNSFSQVWNRIYHIYPMKTDIWKIHRFALWTINYNLRS